MTIYRGPDVAHYGFTKITIPVLERKLATYKALARTSGELRHRDAVEHYRKLRESFEYCPLTKSYQFTRRARRLLMRVRACSDDGVTFHVHSREVHKVVSKSDEERVTHFVKPRVADFRTNPVERRVLDV